MKALLNSAIAAIFLIPSLVMAGGSGTTFGELDKDGDGKLSIQEAGAHEGLSTQFIQLDVDKNGYLTPGEVSAYEPETTGVMPGAE